MQLGCDVGSPNAFIEQTAVVVNSLLLHRNAFRLRSAGLYAVTFTRTQFNVAGSNAAAFHAPVGNSHPRDFPGSTACNLPENSAKYTQAYTQGNDTVSTNQ